MLLKIVLGLIVVVAVFLVYVATRPSHFEVARSTTIAAAPSAIFPHVNTARAWEVWSPFKKADPDAKFRYEGPAAGVGAVTAWEGKRAGVGRCTTVESREAELIRYRLDMEKPITSSNEVEFRFEPEGSGTRVTWRMSGENGFAGKAFGVFVNCEKMVGGEFEQGLADLKRLVERNAPSVAGK